jgi:parallel beta-helix repeat protein
MTREAGKMREEFNVVYLPAVVGACSQQQALDLAASADIITGSPICRRILQQKGNPMSIVAWLTRAISRARRRGVKRGPVCLRVEALESRTVLSALAAGPHVLQVNPADPQAYHTIQAAVDAASPGTDIVIFSGTYKEAVTVSTPNLRLAGAAGATVVIANPGGAMNGITVAGVNGAPLSGFALANVTVSGFDSDGVFLNGVTGFVLSQVMATNNVEYGLFPVLCANGQITHSSASGSNDTGIYVGQSANVDVQDNTVFDNVNGIEIENSTGVSATHNTVFGNTVGILADLLPGFPLPYEVSAHNTISDNTVFLNNRANTAPADDIAVLEPPGTGIALIGGEHTQVQGNNVYGNAFAGIAVLSGSDLLALAQLAGIPLPSYPPGVDTDPEHTQIHDNVVLGNGFAPGMTGFPQPADLVWTGTGQHNHWNNNLFLTSSPSELP